MKLTRSEIEQVALEAAVCPRTVVDYLGGLNTQPAGRRRIEAVLAGRGFRAREPLVRTSSPATTTERGAS